MLRMAGWAIVLVCLAAPSATADTELQRQTLKNLQGVEVLVGHLGPEAERDGLSRSTILVDVQLRLRQAGITVVSDKDGAPTLYVRVNALRFRDQPSGLYAYSVALDLRQPVTGPGVGHLPRRGSLTGSSPR